MPRRVAAFAGYSGAGKTTLIEQIIPRLAARGLWVSVIKHVHHGFDMDKPGKDTWRHREAGAREVLAVSDERLVLMREFRDPPVQRPTLPALLAQLNPAVDWVLVEGFKDVAQPKVEVWRPGTGHPPRHPNDPWVQAVATDTPAAVANTHLPVLDLNQPDQVVAWLLDNAERFA